MSKKDAALKNNAPFRSCITKTNSILIDNAEDLDVVMLMYDMFEYNDNYSMTSGSLWNYSRDKCDDDSDDDASKGKSFKCKTKINKKKK